MAKEELEQGHLLMKIYKGEGGGKQERTNKQNRKERENRQKKEH